MGSGAYSARWLQLRRGRESALLHQGDLFQNNCTHVALWPHNAQLQIPARLNACDTTSQLSQLLSLPRFSLPLLAPPCPQITLDPCTVLQPHTHPHSEFTFTIKGEHVQGLQELIAS